LDPRWVEVFVDGASRGNPGPAGMGVIFRQEKGPTLLTLKEYLGETTNNVAEYRALLAALEEAARRGFKRLRIHTDSQLMERQLNGVYRVRQPHLIGLYQQALRDLTKLEQYEILHVPRELNKEADELANKAIEEHFGR
jgi:ribonuclease HI